MPGPGFLDRFSRWSQRLDQRLLPPAGRFLSRMGRGALRPRVLSVGAMLFSLVVVLLAVYAAGRAPAQPRVASGAGTRLGPAPGEPVSRYVADSRAALAQLVADDAASPAEPRMYALVSLSSYATPAELGPILVDLRVTDVFLHVPVAGVGTEIRKVGVSSVPDELVRAMMGAAGEKSQHILDVQAFLDGLTGSGQERDALRAKYRADIAVSAAEQAGYNAVCRCAFAAVVYATPAQLGTLAARAGVRVVQAAPGLRVLDGAVLSPPLPGSVAPAVPSGCAAPLAVATPDPDVCRSPGPTPARQ